MKNITDELISQIDSNNMKAHQILKSVVKLMESEADGIDYMTMIESALDYVEKNNETFKRNM